MRAVGEHPLRAPLLQGPRALAEGPRGVGDVVDDDAGAPLHLADDVHHLGFVRPRPALVDDGELRVVELLRDGPGPHHASDVRRDHDRIGQLPAPDVPDEDRRGVDVVHGNVEEALDLVRVKVHRQRPVCPRGRDHVRHHLGRDGDPHRARAAVLAGVAEVRDDGGDARGRCPAYRVHHDDELHQVLVGRPAGGVDDEDVLPADRVVDLDVDLAVPKPAHRRPTGWDPETCAHVVHEPGA